MWVNNRKNLCCCWKTVSVSMLQLKFQIDSVLTQGNTGALLSCRCSSHHHNSTYKPKKVVLRGRNACLIPILAKNTQFCHWQLHGGTPQLGCPSQPVVRAVQPDVRHADYHCFPFTTPPKQHREMERERERGKNDELYKILCNKHSSPPNPNYQICWRQYNLNNAELVCDKKT